MKATDLMIGDWVQFPHGIDKIVDLPYIAGKGICASFAASATLFPVEIDKLLPIPLTKEILIKNGWLEESDYENDLYGGHFPEDKKLRLELDIDGSEVWWTINSVEYYIIPLCYVHELQHALRLCKINKEIEL